MLHCILRPRPKNAQNHEPLARPDHYTDMLRLLPLILLLTLTACEGNTAARKAARGTNFVPDPNHIYFKNIRTRHYRATEVTNRATLYHHEDLYDSEARLLAELVDNWIQDRALIRFSTRPEMTDWQLVAKETDGLVPMPLTVPPTNGELARLFGLLSSPTPLLLVTTTDTLAAFPNDAGRQETRVVINDYLRLVEYEE